MENAYSRITSEPKWSHICCCF